nr:helicase associated domain-containing protein [Streptomyces antibioticus]
MWDDFALGTWLKTQRAAAKKARENSARRANGETGISYAEEMSPSRMQALEEIDPGWCPEWEHLGTPSAVVAPARPGRGRAARQGG